MEQLPFPSPSPILLPLRVIVHQLLNRSNCSSLIQRVMIILLTFTCITFGTLYSPVSTVSPSISSEIVSSTLQPVTRMPSVSLTNININRARSISQLVRLFSPLSFVSTTMRFTREKNENKIRRIAASNSNEEIQNRGKNVMCNLQHSILHLLSFSLCSCASAIGFCF